ncbi:dTDP-4-dehydrorhamnose reductase [Gilvibacter sp.]|uniref:dTDP-4-dehydrorhamnose reductase n=1 Tax=Gilvibacter sp. TaxID=2729997 RepID=UPI0025B819F7|nr:dTDP-4-dehydrorhamnose reductase [Gilvibacter sp.]NQX78577.1 dTDP-4-dehydrorhamnose reductase [Gilvibacter sp.]
MGNKRILITGASGQLGQCLKATVPESLADDVLWAARKELDLTDINAVEALFETHQFDYCINTAAYTAVDKAESDRDAAFALNAEAVAHLAKCCEKHNTVLIHPSTDYVFGGMAKEPYTEEYPTAPINVYGASKEAGEVAIREALQAHFIVRTSWLYSPYGHNFYRSIRKKLEEGAELTITTDQTGTPTNGLDLAEFFWKLISEKASDYGTYHYSNEGEATWYDFAIAIASGLSKKRENQVASTEHYATFAARPAYSVLSKEKIKEVFGVNPPNWKTSLHQLINHD